MIVIATPKRYALTHALRAGGATVRMRGYDVVPRRLKAVPSEVARDPDTTWVHLAHVGEWRGHRDGGFELTAEIFAAVIANFERQANPLPWNYEHGFAPDGSQPSPGWTYDLRVEGGVLYGLTRFGRRDAADIRAKRYQYCSIEIVFDDVDRASGESVGATLRAVALTNQPFIDGQAPITLEAAA